MKNDKNSDINTMDNIYMKDCVTHAFGLEKYRSMPTVSRTFIG